jgi:hypothetical protein
MSWKTDLKLSDLDAATQIEVICKRCGLSRYELQAALMRWPDLAQAYLNEVEHALRRSNRSSGERSESRCFMRARRKVLLAECRNRTNAIRGCTVAASSFLRMRAQRANKLIYISIT